jgi:prolyl-tRNA synthetase
VITDVARREIKSYRQLPVNFYQIQTKFRDEIRPRFGVMRAREFLMKDAYSFHARRASWTANTATCTTPTAASSRASASTSAPVAADTGAIGGTGSHEFHVLADSGEDAIAFCPTSDYAANVELAEALAPAKRYPRGAGGGDDGEGPTPNKTKCEDVAAFLGLPLTQTVKAIAVMAEKEGGRSSCCCCAATMTSTRSRHRRWSAQGRSVPLRHRRGDRRGLGCKAGYIGPVGFAGGAWSSTAASP